jgi:hypothetical protein
MTHAVTIYDETVPGTKTKRFTLENLTERMTVREIIRARIYQEVQDFNQKLPELFNGLVQPTDAERTLNGFKFSKPRPLNWERQYHTAVEQFGRNGFIVLIGDRQAESLDEHFTVAADTEVSFLKLMPLVGG